ILKRSQGNMAEAQKYLQNSLNLNNFESAISLGLIYVDQNEIALAERVFLKAINSKDSAPIAYRNLAFLYYKTNQKKEQSLEYINRAVQLDEDSIINKFCRQIIYLWCHKLNEFDSNNKELETQYDNIELPLLEE